MDAIRIACRNRILSNSYLDLLFDFDVTPRQLFGDSVETPDYCEEVLFEHLKILHVAANQLSPLDGPDYRYQYTPKCYGLIQDTEAPPSVGQPVPGTGLVPDLTALSEAGILSVSGPPLELTGKNVLLGIIDTGIRYQLPSFRRSDGSTRVLSIWDQTNQQGMPPDGFDYGTEFTEAEINYNLENEGELLVTDETGHGTKVAGVAGGYDRTSGFLGAAPDASFIVVKLKQAKEYLREFYQIPSNVPCFQETDIMLALQYLDRMAEELNRPLVTCIALGTTMGAHDGTSLLDYYVNELARKRKRCIVIGGGNEGNSSGHYEGNLVMAPGAAQDNEEIEVLVGQGENGLWMELWGKAPGIFTVSITSPNGETIPEIPFRIGQSVDYTFIYSNTRITVKYILVEQGNGQELIVMRFQNLLPGIWKIRVNVSGGGGNFHIWLPMRNFLEGDTYFLRPSPYNTMTEPAYTRDVMTVTTYNSGDGSFYLNSGRGFSTDGYITPDLAAPGVGIPTPLLADTGSSMSAAMAAGAAACFMQWAVVEEHDILVNTSAIKNYFIRGAKRRTDSYYPTREWGYGTLDLAGVFQALAGI